MKKVIKFKMKTVHIIAWILLIVGGLNWALVGLFEFDLVASIFGNEFGTTSTLSSIVYILVGLSAVLELFGHKSKCKACNVSPSGSQMP